VIHLRSVSLNRVEPEAANTFPFNVGVIRALTTIEFSTAVTFLVGENGSGKSTFLEALAVAANMIAVGSSDIQDDQTLRSVRRLAQKLKLIWNKRTRKGFFLRAEDYFGYARRLAQMREGMEQDLRDIEQEFAGRSKTALGLAQMPFLRELHDLKEKYGGDLDNYSHGESFFTFFQARFVADGLYLLDEPEAPLSDLDDEADGGAAQRPVHHRHALADSDGLPWRDDPEFRQSARTGCELRRTRTRHPDARILKRPRSVLAASVSQT
jgi:predicted ATPase